MNESKAGSVRERLLVDIDNLVEDEGLAQDDHRRATVVQLIQVVDFLERKHPGATRKEEQ